MSNSKKLFFLTDLYAFNFNLLFKKKDKYQTYFGSVTGLISIISFIFIIILYSTKLLNRKQFNIISISQRDQNSSFILNNYLLMFGLIDSYGNNILNDSKITKILINYFEDNISYNINYSSKICDEYESYFSDFNNPLRPFLECVILNNISLIGRMGNEKYNFISFSFLICEDDNCYDKKVIEEKLQNIYFFLFIPEYQINHYNYKNPITKTFRGENIQFSYNTFKLYEYFFSEIHYFSDDGLIFSNHKMNKFLMIESFQIDFKNIGVSNYGQIKLGLSLNKIEYYRSYLKFQDALADIAVLIEIIKYIVNYFTLIFTKQLFDIELVNTIMFPNNNNNININNRTTYSKKDNIDSSHMRLGLYNKFSIISNINTNKYKYNNKTDIINKKMFKNLKIKKHNILIHQKNENSEISSSSKIKKPIKMKWYYYLLFRCFLKQNKKYFILLKCKEKIDEYISIDYIIPRIINNKDIFLKQLFEEVNKNNEQLLF